MASSGDSTTLTAKFSRSEEIRLLTLSSTADSRGSLPSAFESLDICNFHGGVRGIGITRMACGGLVQNVKMRSSVSFLQTKALKRKVGWALFERVPEGCGTSTGTKAARSGGLSFPTTVSAYFRAMPVNNSFPMKNAPRRHEDSSEETDLNMVQKDPNRNEWKMPLERLLVEGKLSSIVLFHAMEALASPG
ncbi:hypothetical protein M5K25_018999 [Dendrobium thyrsiflorum]|uniref:Uncharacterized protein n=1 Tax=Dendrobium thyrsiflorum TaxID=117978 RepID=A0ABD0UKY1_DENTH